VLTTLCGISVATMTCVVQVEKGSWPRLSLNG
jgi:hypothetical protein